MENQNLLGGNILLALWNGLKPFFKAELQAFEDMLFAKFQAWLEAKAIEPSLPKAEPLPSGQEDTNAPPTDTADGDVPMVD